MQNICNKCGLPLELCVCETISKEAQKIKVYTMKKRFGKLSTIVDGLDEKSIDIKSLVSKMKSKLACGGTFKNGQIELQGKHVSDVKKILISEGFDEKSITVSGS